MENNICQSCAMPLTSEDMYATEKDGTVNKDYCKWCYDKGEFVENCTMEECDLAFMTSNGYSIFELFARGRSNLCGSKGTNMSGTA